MKLFAELRRNLKFMRRKATSARRPLVAPDMYFVGNIELTNNCPMKCVMCPRTGYMSRDLGYMEFDLYRSIVDQMIADNPAHTSGKHVALHHFGESLMHREVDRFVAYAEAKGISTVLSVNPITFTDRVIDQLLRAAPTQLYISLDGHDDASFLAIRGVPKSYERSKENLFKYLARKQDAGVKTRIVVNMIDFSLNAGSIKKLKEYWEDVPGIDEFCAKPFGTWNGDAERINAFRNGESGSAAGRPPRSYVSCNRPWEVLTVAWDGDVLPCCYDYDKKEVVGDARTQTLKSIWNGDRMRHLRQQFVSDDVRSALCRECEELRTIL